MGNFQDAAVALEKEARDEQRLDTKHVMLSISKLAALAKFEDLETVEATKAVQDLILELDWVSIHERLIAEFNGGLVDIAYSSTNADLLEDTIASTSATTISSQYPAFLLMFKRLVKQLYQGQALKNEDLADLLTLKDHPSNSTDDFSHAMQIVAGTGGVSEGRLKSAVRSIWRRLLISDDWAIYKDTSDLNDDELNDSLRSTRLYTTLSLLGENPSISAEIYGYLRLHEVLECPGTTELVTRYPGLTASQVEDLEEDLNGERTTLEILLGDFQLEMWLEKVMMMEKSDRLQNS